MPKLIFKCRHMKAGSATHRTTYVRYIAMRDGVEIPRTVPSSKPATQKQQNLIADILSSFPDAAELFEYEDYLASPTLTNASEFIIRALEDNYADAIGRKRYVSYLATRPGVVTQGSHGLFGADEGVPSLAKVIDAASNHPGTVWTPILSLRREDAARLGYDNPERWQQLIRAKAVQMAEGLKIPTEDFVWYAAYHDEGSHPHVHMVCWSRNPQKGFLTVQGIKSIKSEFTKEIFRDELHELYTRQTQYRNMAQAGAEEKLREAIARMKDGVLDTPHIADLMLRLAERLKGHSGKLQYGYLRPPVKAMVLEVVDALAADPLVADAYSLWCDARREVLLGYSDKPADIPPLSQNDLFKPVRNMIVRMAAELMREDAAQIADVLENVDSITLPPAEDDLPIVQSVTDHSVPNSTSASVPSYWPVTGQMANISALPLAVRLMRDLASIFEQRPPDYKISTTLHIDRKRRRELRQKTGGKHLLPEEPQAST